MGSSVKGRISSEYSTLDICHALENIQQTKIQLIETNMPDYDCLMVERNGDLRRLNVHLNSIDEEVSPKTAYTQFSMDNFGLADEVISQILACFSGYYLSSDTDEQAKWTFIPSSSSIHITPEQLTEEKLYKQMDTQLSTFTKREICRFVVANLDFIKKL
jgi:hypothetical protein